MSDLFIGGASLACVFVLLMFRVPIGLPMLVIGIAGAGGLSGDWKGVWISLSGSVYFTFASYGLAILPLLILMGQFSKLAQSPASMYRVARSFLGHLRGGVALSAIAATLGMSSINGSNRTTSTSLQPLLEPELNRHDYSNPLKVLSLTLTETVGVLMPPSILLVIYATLTEQEIARLFVAAAVPLILALLGYALAIGYSVRRMPMPTAAIERASWSERLAALYNVWPIMLIFVLVVGGIYFEWFHPTEAAAVGAIGMALIALSTSTVTWQSFKESILATAFLSARLYLLVLGAAFFNAFLASTNLPQEFSVLVLLHDYSPWLVLVLMLLIFFVFASRSDSLALILLVVPLFYPIVSNLDFGLSVDETAIWFGILVLSVVEMGMLFIAYAALRTRQAGQLTFKGRAFLVLMPFLVMIGLRLTLLLIWPGIALQLGRMV